ncbi:hypothetical protein E4U23_007477 [Claviceps purpurea]|nr:hypothetical protein E4U28_005272 [Claviceps purpurea]KAG6176117.1 hypothetical protein E4U27_005500 [Claviceps purpurea]KAG6240519.1 hypothetical protein E4U23_007477 [Claviceps purpurea]
MSFIEEKRRKGAVKAASRKKCRIKIRTNEWSAKSFSEFDSVALKMSSEAAIRDLYMLGGLKLWHEGPIFGKDVAASGSAILRTYCFLSLYMEPTDNDFEVRATDVVLLEPVFRREKGRD